MVFSSAGSAERTGCGGADGGAYDCAESAGPLAPDVPESAAWAVVSAAGRAAGEGVAAAEPATAGAAATAPGPTAGACAATSRAGAWTSTADDGPPGSDGTS